MYNILKGGIIFMVKSSKQLFASIASLMVGSSMAVSQLGYTGSIASYAVESTEIVDVATAYVGEEVAKATALADVGIQESNVKYVNVWLAYDNGLPECYKVEFQSEQVEYKYKIDLYSGEVLEKILTTHNDEDVKNDKHGKDDKDDEDDKADDSELGYISRESAKAIALEDASIQESDVKYANVWIDYAQGQPSYYVVKFGRRYEHGIRYKYEIDLYSGEILTASTENYGDVNSDGEVSVSDVIVLHKYLHGVKSLTQEEYEVADINADGIVNIFDFVNLKQEIFLE